MSVEAIYGSVDVLLERELGTLDDAPAILRLALSFAAHEAATSLINAGKYVQQIDSEDDSGDSDPQAAPEPVRPAIKLRHGRSVKNVDYRRKNYSND